MEQINHICPVEIGYINRQYFWPFVLCAGFFAGSIVTIFGMAKLSQGLANSIKLSEVCKGVK